MQMLIGQIAAPVQAAGTKGTPAGGTGSGKAFNHLLIQTVNGIQPGTSSGSADIVPTPVLPGLVSEELAALFSGDTKEGVQKKLTDLIKLLQDGDNQKADAQNADDLQAMLDQMDKLLASIMNVPAASLVSQPTLPEDASADTSSDSPGALMAVKKELQDVLTQLQTLLQQGTGSGMTKEQLSVVSKQLDTLRQVVEGKPVKAPETNTIPLSNPEDENSEQVQHAAAQTGGNIHLNKMSHQSIHTRLLVAVPSDTSKAPESSKTPAVSVMPQLLQKLAGPTAESMAEPQVVKEVPQEQPQTIQQMLMSTLGTVPGATKAADGTQTVLQPVPAQQFSSAMTGMIIKQFGITRADGMSEARISLLPEHLGQVDVRISLQNGQLTAHFVTDSAAAKDIMENQLAALRSSLQSQGLQVDKLEVTQNQIQGQMFQEDRRQGSGNQQQSKQGGSKEEPLSDVLQGFEMELVEQAAAGELGYGRGINITA